MKEFLYTLENYTKEHESLFEIQKRNLMSLIVSYQKLWKKLQTSNKVIDNLLMPLRKMRGKIQQKRILEEFDEMLTNYEDRISKKVEKILKEEE